MRTLRGGAGALVVEEHGQGPVPVVLVHGMAGDATFWHDAIAALAGRHRLIVPELRGHGRSAPARDGDYSIEANARDLLAVLEQLALPRYLLVGHSFGASIVIEMAARAPERVAGLVSVDGAGDFSHVPADVLTGFMAGLESDESYAATVEGAIDIALAGARPDTERRIRAAILAAPWPLVRSVYRALLAYRPTGSLDRYLGPTLLVTAPANAASFALHALRPLVPRHSVTGVSHWLMMDDPAGFAGVLDRFLAELALDEQ